ncbi:MAG: outer membrane beta-barrel protein [Paludibacteraceae bacterium]
MKKKVFIPILFLFISISLSAQDDLGKQLWRNFNFGWEVYRTDDYRWRNLFIGSGYYTYFKSVPKAYVYAGMNINWSKYSIYSSGDYALRASDATLKTTSVSVPLYAGYQVFKDKGFGLTLYTGPSFDLILASKLDGQTYDKINHFQTGWTVGGTLQFLYLMRLRIAYSYYPVSLLSDFNMPRSAFTFSFGF